MSSAWETTPEDVGIVLSRHGIHVTDEELDDIHDQLDFDAIEDGVLYYTDFGDQVDSMLDDVETQLMELGYLPTKEKKYHAPQL